MWKGWRKKMLIQKVISGNLQLVDAVTGPEHSSLRNLIFIYRKIQKETLFQFSSKPDIYLYKDKKRHCSDLVLNGYLQLLIQCSQWAKIWMKKKKNENSVYIYIYIYIMYKTHLFSILIWFEQITLLFVFKDLPLNVRCGNQCVAPCRDYSTFKSDRV